MPLLPPLEAFAAGRKTEFDRIAEQRRETLAKLANWVRERTSDEHRARLNFICTHNSRRSQISQVWARAAAAHAGIEGVETYSGGTQATAFHPLAVDALRRAGFEIERESEQDNPVYIVRYDAGSPAIRTFSKIHDREPNPAGDFCAVMNCAAADANCPVIPGASLRVALPYDDPGEADGTRREREAYDLCCRRIGRDILYLFSLVRR